MVTIVQVLVQNQIEIKNQIENQNQIEIKNQIEKPKSANTQNKKSEIKLTVISCYIKLNKMIFFSENIKNKIVDETPVDEIMDKLDEFKNDVEMIFTYFNYGSIGIDYIQNLLNYESNRIAFYCSEDKFVIRSCPSCMIYSKQNKKKQRHNYVLYYGYKHGQRI